MFGALESFKMLFWRRIEKIKWSSERVTSEQVLERIGEKRILLNDILLRKDWSYSEKKLPSS